MKKAVVYVHGKGGSPGEAEHYRPLFLGYDVIGYDYISAAPWEAKDEFEEYFASLKNGYDSVILIANSIGAFFALEAGIDSLIDKAYLISPIVDMEALILGMMSQAGVSEEELREKKTISAGSGEDLSWDYLTYVRDHPVLWDAPTDILYGSRDLLQSYDTVEKFALEHDASLTVMEGGEHWFHTEEQMRFLDGWLTGKQGEHGIG